MSYYDAASFKAGFALGRMLWKPPSQEPLIHSDIYSNADGTCVAIVLTTHEDAEHVYAARYVTEEIGMTAQDISTSGALPIAYATGSLGDRLLVTQYNGRGYVLALNALLIVQNQHNVGMAYLMANQWWYTNWPETANQQRFVSCSAYARPDDGSYLTLPESTVDPTTVTIDDMHPILGIPGGA